MNPYSFKNWMVVEFKDVFGFERDKTVEKEKEEKNQGAFPSTFENIIQEIAKHAINGKQPRELMKGGVIWGNGVGSIKVDVAPLGSIRFTIRRLLLDLTGEPIWICKSVVIPDKNQDDIVGKILEIVKKIDVELLEKPDKEYSELERLTLYLVGDIRRNHPKVMMYDGVKRMNNFHYLIFMSMTGYGVEAPDHERVEQFDVNVVFDKEAGIIRVWGNDIASPTKRHDWASKPSEWDEKFCPAQSQEEITKAVAACLKVY